jgi:hypothetical protein
LSIDGESAQTAKELFCHWGMLFELSNGDLVLNPQQLADVLACVFTKDAGKVAKMGETYLSVEVANGVEIQVQRTSVLQVLPKGTFK